MRALRFVLALVLGLGLLTWLASVGVHRTTRDWFERDVSLRARLAVTGARETLVSRWGRDQRNALRASLNDLTRDERIMAAAACGADLALLATTPEFPKAFSCSRVGPHLRASPDVAADAWTIWEVVDRLPGGSVHVSAIPLLDGERALGFVVLVHDLSFVERREARTQQFLLLAFGFLALAASAVTIVAARLSWLGWSRELRRFLQTGAERPEFRPLLRTSGSWSIASSGRGRRRAKGAPGRRSG
jgi:trehalose 6-phosphate synthase